MISSNNKNAGNPELTDIYAQRMNNFQLGCTFTSTTTRTSHLQLTMKTIAALSVLLGLSRAHYAIKELTIDGTKWVWRKFADSRLMRRYKLACSWCKIGWLGRRKENWMGFWRPTKLHLDGAHWPYKPGLCLRQEPETAPSQGSCTSGLRHNSPLDQRSKTPFGTINECKPRYRALSIT